MASPTVSVVIPSYNSARWVAEAAESVLSQTVTPFQVIVVDDGSTDDTRDVLAGYVSRGVNYIHQQNSGVAAARNAGIRQATGEYVAFLDADDFWHPKKLQFQCRQLAAGSEFVMVGTKTFDWPGMVPEIPKDGAALSEIRWRALAVRNYFTTSSVLVRRSALQRLGGELFDTALHGPEDYDLWLRLAEIGKVGNLELQLTGYRSVAGSLGKQARTMEEGIDRILRKLDDRDVWSTRGDRLLRRKAHAYFRYSSGYLYGESGDRWGAVKRLLRATAGYPLPFARHEVRMRFARPKLLAVNVKALLMGKTSRGKEANA